MGEFAANEKYPDSYRLDHQDFEDVGRTTFAKGVIKEFDKISDVPLKVRSMVKVEIEEKGVSDFIPLFYHPKKRYWDDEEKGIKATDFNQEKKYFEQAWMSFRKDDEVRVILREGEPYAVVGFYDGKPKIGEDIIKFAWKLFENQLIAQDGANISWMQITRGLFLNENDYVQEGDHYCYLQASKRDYYGEVDAEQKGKDDLDLQLIKEVIPFNCISDLVTNISETFSFDQYPDQNHGNTLAGHVEGSSSLKEIATLKEWLIPIGPILYSFHLFTVESIDEGQTDVWYQEYPNYPQGPELVHEATIIVHNELRYYDYIIQANLYSEDLFNKLQGMRKSVKEAFEQYQKQNKNWSSIDDGSLIVQQGNGDGPLPDGFRDNWKSVDFFSPPWSARTGGEKTEGPYGIDPATFKIYIRPHSEEEEAA